MSTPFPNPWPRSYLELSVSQSILGIELYTFYSTGCWSQWPYGLRRRWKPLDSWDCGFESHWVHGCSSVVFVVCWVGSGLCWSLVQRSPTGWVCARLIVCDLATSTIRWPKPDLGSCGQRRNSVRLRRWCIMSKHINLMDFSRRTTCTPIQGLLSNDKMRAVGSDIYIYIYIYIYICMYVCHAAIYYVVRFVQAWLLNY